MAPKPPCTSCRGRTAFWNHGAGLRRSPGLAETGQETRPTRLGTGWVTRPSSCEAIAKSKELSGLADRRQRRRTIPKARQSQIAGQDDKHDHGRREGQRERVSRPAFLHASTALYRILAPLT